jgi:hypothetical protein
MRALLVSVLAFAILAHINPCKSLAQVVNGDFENGLTSWSTPGSDFKTWQSAGWTSFTCNVVAYDASSPVDHYASLQAYADSPGMGTSGRAGQRLEQNFLAHAGDILQLSVKRYLDVRSSVGYSGAVSWESADSTITVSGTSYNQTNSASVSCSYTDHVERSLQNPWTVVTFPAFTLDGSYSLSVSSSVSVSGGEATDASAYSTTSVDNVRLIQVPEPQSLVYFLTGAMVFRVYAKRRRRA